MEMCCCRRSVSLFFCRLFRHFSLLLLKCEMLTKTKKPNYLTKSEKIERHHTSYKSRKKRNSECVKYFAFFRSYMNGDDNIWSEGSPSQFMFKSFSCSLSPFSRRIASETEFAPTENRVIHQITAPAYIIVWFPPHSNLAHFTQCNSGATTTTTASFFSYRHIDSILMNY